MNFLFLMDPLETVKVYSDTSFIFMLGAHQRGHKVFYLPSGGISLKKGLVHFKVTEVIPVVREEGMPFDIVGETVLTEKEASAVFIRTDPPFDAEYLMNTWLLERAESNVAVINSPHGIRTVNEKVWATQFTELIPRTVISRHLSDFKEFLAEEKNIIIKPTDGFGGVGVFKISEDAPNKNVSFEMLSDRDQKEVIMQQYIPEAAIGDKRILLLDGDPLGAVLRVHGEDDHRNNFYAGGKPVESEITHRDLEVIKTLKPYLKKLGLHFVGIDMLGDYLIEVNVTSPTCLQEMNRLYDCKLEDKVIQFAENLVNERNKN